MTENEPLKSENQAELLGRLSVIESMITEGRHTTARWGWSFVLWGTAYLVATAWMIVGGGDTAKYAWPVTMVAASAVSGMYGMRVRRRQGSVTVVGRAMQAIWTAMGMALFLFCWATGVSGRWEPHLMFAAIETILGMAYIASAIILRWKAQGVCGLLWWAMAVVALFGNIQQAGVGFIAGTVVCLVGFGIYMMVVEGRGGRVGMSHA